MCFYCWKCSPQDSNDPEDAYYSMTICCFSKNILYAIIWLFSIRLIFDIIFTIIFIIFDIPFFIFFTLIVVIALIAAISGIYFKFKWIYYCFGIITTILLILDLGSLSYIIYSISKGGWLYNYAHKHISKKSDESLFVIDERNYTATDVILIVFAIFLLISFLHDLTNLLMVNRSLQFLKRFHSKKANRPQRNFTHMDSQRNGITNQPGDQGYRKRPSELSIPSVVAPKTETTQRLSYIDIPTQPLTPIVTTITYPPQPQPLHQQQQPERSLVLINGGYSFLERKRTISNTAAATEAVTTSNYEIPNQHFRTNATEYPSEMNDRIQVQDLESPYGNPNKKNSKNSKTQPIQPNEVPPIPPKILNQSSRSQNSESSSSIFKNTIYNRNLEQQHYVPNSPFIPIDFNPLTTEERPNMDSVQESEVSSIDSSFNEHPTSNWNTEANVKCENQNEAHYTSLNHDMTHEEKFESNIYQPKSNWNTEANTKHESHLETSAIETHYSNIKNPELPLQQSFGSYAQQQSSSTWIKNTNVVSTTNENYPNAIKNQRRILSTNSTINPNQDLYANLSPELPPRRQRHGISSHSNDEMEQQLNTATESAIKGQKNEDSISFTSTESNSDIVAFWSHHPSTRRRRTSNDLLNKKGFLTDESSEDGEVVRVPKVITSNKPPLKNYGLTQILQLEKGKLESDVQQPSLLSMVYGKSNEIDKQQTKEIRSDSLIIALESIKVMEEDNENGNISKYQTMEITTESYSRTNNIQQERYGTNYQTTEITTHSNCENIPYKSNPEEIKSFSNDIALKRESMSFKPDEIHKTESTEIFVTPKTNFRRTFEVKKEATMTPETPIIPSTSNFFDTWGKAADRNYLDQTKTTVPFNLRKTKLEETEKNIVANVREESDSDSTMTFSSLSSDEEDSESDIDKRMIKLKQKIQAHLPQNINQEKKHAENKAEAGSSRSAVTNVEEFSSVQEEAPQPFQFKRLPLIGSAINTPPQSAEIFSTPPTSPIFQIPSANLSQQPPSLPKMPPPSLP